MKREVLIPRIKLDTKVDIPFEAAQVTIYQPSIEEIGLIGENEFLIGVNALSKNYKNIQDNSDLSEMSNFDIFMSVIGEKTENSKRIARAISSVLFLIFPNYKIGFTPRAIVLKGEEEQAHIIDANNFDEFGQLLFEIFCLGELIGDMQGDYNPAGDRARAIVEKFKNRREFLAELRKERGQDPTKMSLYGRYINILAVGLGKNKNELKQYSVYQLIEEFKRFTLKQTFDYTFQAKMAGATKLKDAKDWMGDVQFGDIEED